MTGGMKALSLNKLKKELESINAEDVLEICMKMAKFKKENKELLSYLLFDSNFEPEYISTIKSDIDVAFSEININNLYYAKKGIRKILRLINKYIRYSGLKRTEVEIRIHFCKKLLKSGVPVQTSASLNNILNSQIMKINKAILQLHEDLQYDYQQEIKNMINLNTSENI